MSGYTEMIQYTDDEGWRCLMQRVYLPKDPTIPMTCVWVSNKASTRSVRMTRQSAKIDKEECIKMIDAVKDAIKKIRKNNVRTK